MILAMALPAAFLAAQEGPDQKARLGAAVTAAQKAYDSGNLEQAEDALREVGSLVHDDARAVMLRARVNFDLGEFGKAASFAQRAAELEPSDVAPRLFAGRALFQMADRARTDPLASASRVGGFFEGALAEFDRCLKLKPDDPDVLVWKARCLFWLNRVPESMQVYEALRKARPDDPAPCLHLAQAHADLGNPDAAVKVATEGLLAKGASNVRGDLAQVIFNVMNQAGKTAEMFAIFKSWSAAHPSDPLAWLWMGYVRFLEKNYDEAIGFYQKGFDASGRKHAGLALELGNALAQKGDLPKAAEAYGAALKLQSEWPNYDFGPIGRLSVIAATWVQKRDYAKAVDVLEKHALPAAESDWSTMNNLGLFYRDWADSSNASKSDAKARNEKALGYYLKASKLVVDADVAGSLKAGVLNDTGVIYDYQLGNMEKGIEYYREALKHDPAWKDALENLGVCFNKLGKYEEAIPLFEKVLEQEPGRPKSVNGLAEARKAVGKGEKPPK
jgi:tetratricopeptide (TPR) repeat protein